MGESLEGVRTGELLARYAAILAELRRRDVVRTNNAPAGDYVEWLVARALGVQRVTSTSEKSYDLIAGEYGKMQLKARVVSEPIKAGQRQTSPFRSWDFDHAALVQLRDVDYAVVRAVLLPMSVVREVAVFQRHINGSIVFMTPALLGHPQATDVTDRLQQAALEVKA